MRISIALATYNGAGYLREQLASFLSQTRMPDELVVSDDNSTDDTRDIINEFKGRAPFEVHLFQNASTIGHELNFGCAIERCSGDLIFLSDQDDVWLPEKLSEVERAFALNPAVWVTINDLAITNRILVGTGRSVLGQTESSGTLGEGGKNFIIGCATAFRANLRQLILPIPSLSYGHDKWIHLVGHILGCRLVMRRVLQLYRRHGENASSWAFDGASAATWRDMVRPTAGFDLTPAYLKELKAIDFLAERLRVLGPTALETLAVPRSFTEVLAELEGAQRAFLDRINVVRASPPRRVLLALRMLLGGRYRHFVGWRSFAKDLIR